MQMASRDPSSIPTLKRQGKLVEQADLTVTKERQARVPNVTLFGMYAREAGREGVVGGVSLPTPLWYRQQGHIATALGTQRQEEAELFRARNDLIRAINQHAHEAETAQEQILVYEEGLIKQAQEALRIAQLSFRQRRLQPPGCSRCPTGPTPDHRGLQSGAVRTLSGAHAV